MHEVLVQCISWNTGEGKAKEAKVSRSEEEIDELLDDSDAPAGGTPNGRQSHQVTEFYVEGESMRFTRRGHHSQRMLWQNI